MSKAIPSGAGVVLMRNNQRGFMLLSVIFLTLIVSIGAQILLNANVKVQQRNSTLYLTAINLANEQFAEIESRAAAGTLDAGNFLIKDIDAYKDDLKSFNGIDSKKVEDGTAVPVEFDVSADINDYSTGTKKAKVIVKWTVGGKEKSIVSEKIIRAANSIAED